MNERLGESLSALMDDEANELELERVLSRAGEGGELRETWRRYNLARQSLRGEEIPHAALDVSARVRSALAGEGTGSAAGIRRRLARPLTSLAVAASVAATVVIGGQQLAQLGSGNAYEPHRGAPTSPFPVGSVSTASATAAPATYVPALRPVNRTAYAELAQRRANRYMQEHAEQAALNSPQGLVPFARVKQIQE